jgi:hypothetical protein
MNYSHSGIPGIDGLLCSRLEVPVGYFCIGATRKRLEQQMLTVYIAELFATCIFYIPQQWKIVPARLANAVGTILVGVQGTGWPFRSRTAIKRIYNDYNLL